MNGTYDLFTSDRHEHGGEGEREGYSQLTWEEVVDVVDAFMVTSGERRISEHRRIIDRQWSQLSLYDLPGGFPPIL